MRGSYYQLFHHGGPYHIKTSSLICRVNQRTDFCVIGASAIKRVKRSVYEKDNEYIEKNQGDLNATILHFRAGVK